MGYGAKHKAFALSLALAMSPLVHSQPALAGYRHLSDEQHMTKEQLELLNPEAARQYMLQLINRDRAEVGAPPVVLEPNTSAASVAGQYHSEEMAVHGYLSHWTMDGRKPDQRYTDAGGRDVVAENAYVSLEGSAAEVSGIPNDLPLGDTQVFHRYELDNIEGDFFHEKAPYDGHRVNIINPTHTSVALGLSLASALGSGIRTACTQEFVTKCGDFDEIPVSVTAGQTFKVTGKLYKGVNLKSIDVRWEQPPQPMTVAQLNKTSSYSMPGNITACYFPVPDQATPQVMVSRVDDQQNISLNLPTGRDWQPGIYYLNVWADVPASKQEAIVSCRVFELHAPSK